MEFTSSITTAEQLIEAVDLGRCELVRGELVMMSPAGAQHGRIVSRIDHRLRGHVEEAGLGEVFGAETGFLIARDPDTVLAPDVAFVTSQRAAAIPDRGFYPGPPDLAVEVLSPEDTASRVLGKVQDWLGAGAHVVWVADPQRRTVSVYRSSQPVEVVAESGVLTCDDLLPGLRLRAADIWP